MNNSHVDSELTTIIIDDKNAHGATSRLKSLGQTRPQVGLINNRDGLLNITGLGHSDNGAILEIENTILLENWTQHSLDDHTWTGVRDERRLLMQLLGEEIDTQISVLAGGTRGCNTDDLARAALKDQEITDANVVAWNSNSVGSGRSFGGSGTGSRGILIIVTHLVVFKSRRLDCLFCDTNLFASDWFEAGGVDGSL